MRRVIVETPYRGKTDEETERNLMYLQKCMRVCLMRGDAPFASHGLYTQPGVLNDKILEERMRGIYAGFAWHQRSQASVVGIDLGFSTGMKLGITNAENIHNPVEGLSLFSAPIFIPKFSMPKNSEKLPILKRVVLEVPAQENDEQSIRYARACLRDSLLRGEAPFSGYLLYFQPNVLSSHIAQEYALAIQATAAWECVAEAAIIYQDYGITKDMEQGITRSVASQRPIAYRDIGKNP